MLQRLLRSVESRAVDMVFVANFARLSRSLLDLQRIRDTFKVNGCDLVSLEDGYYGANEGTRDEIAPSRPV